MRRGAGIGAASRQKAMTQKINTLQTNLEATSTATMQQQLENFQQRLEEFAAKHKDKINKNPIFRSQFQKMCKSIGVDPLASNKGLWGQSLAQMTDFYYELGIQAIQGCLTTKSKNGGMISIEDLISTIRTKRSNVLRIAPKTSTQQEEQQRNANDITADDIKIALEKVSILGNTYKIIDLGGVEMVVSVPIEFQTDHIEIFKLATTSNENTKHRIGCISIELIMEIKKWNHARAQRAINSLLQEGVCWVDKQARNDDNNNGVKIEYWIPSIWLDNQHNTATQQQSPSN